MVEKYFSELFKASSLDGKLSLREYVTQVSENENMGLISDITTEEVTEAVFSMHPDKSPRPDGFNPAFFENF